MTNRLSQRSDITEQVEARIRELPIVEHLGLRIRLLPDRSEVTLERVEAFHLGGVEGDFLNGGIILSMLDAAVASVALREFEGRRCGTVDLSAKIMRPAVPDGVVCVGTVMRRVGRIVFVNATLRGPGDEEYATATGIAAMLASTPDKQKARPAYSPAGPKTE